MSRELHAQAQPVEPNMAVIFTEEIATGSLGECMFRVEVAPTGTALVITVLPPNADRIREQIDLAPMIATWVEAIVAEHHNRPVTPPAGGPV